MAKAPWLTIFGLGEDGPEGLSSASLAALDTAEVVMAPARHLGMLVGGAFQRIEWPVPFVDGIARLMELRGRRVVVLASGDPFWFGAGTVLAKHLEPGEWQAFPGVSSVSLAAARLGWGLEKVQTLGLHAAPLSRLRPHLAGGARIICTLRDGAAVAELATYLGEQGFADSRLVILEALGGPRERVRETTPHNFDLNDVQHPVLAALEIAGPGAAMSLATGRADDWFSHDGQITKRPVRALALSALAPRPGELLWDIGTGSGSISIEWLLSAPSLRAIGFEAHAERARRARENALRMGVDRFEVVETRMPQGFENQPMPDAVFIGGGLSEELLSALWAHLAQGTRLVAHAVTLESEALLANWQALKGGSLLRIELAEAQPLGRKRGWKSTYPIVQWSVTL